MTFIDLFAGVGGFRRGMELAGHRCVGFCEWDRFAAASYISMHLLTDAQRERLAAMDLKKRQKEILKNEYLNGEWYSNDIRSVDAGNVPRADCWCFGAPCQSFSVAGKRAGLGGKSGLVREVFRILRETRKSDRPEWLLYENVKGMLSSNRGFDFLAILIEMDELGYDCEWQLFNSKDWGVPQNRERIYTVGHLRNRGGAKIFPVEGTDGENQVEVMQIGQRDPTLRAQAHVNDPLVVLPAIYDDLDGKMRSDNLSCTLTTKCGVSTSRTGQKVVLPVESLGFANKCQNGKRYKEDNEPSFTLASVDRHGVALGVDLGDGGGDHPGMAVEMPEGAIAWAVWNERYSCYVVVRRLTPRECFRLQGWADEYFNRATFVNSDSQLYRQAGNGVSVPVVYAIGKALQEKGDYCQ